MDYVDTSKTAQPNHCKERIVKALIERGRNISEK